MKTNSWSPLRVLKADGSFGIKLEIGKCYATIPCKSFIFIKPKRKLNFAYDMWQWQDQVEGKSVSFSKLDYLEWREIWYTRVRMP